MNRKSEINGNKIFTELACEAVPDEEEKSSYVFARFRHTCANNIYQNFEKFLETKENLDGC